MLTICCFIDQLQVQLIVDCCNKTLIAISDWVDRNYLQFNVQKCKFMHVTKKTIRSQPASHLTLYGQPLERVNTYKYLGLLLSSDLSWTQHIHNICTKAKKLLNLLPFLSIFYSCKSLSNVHLASSSQSGICQSSMEPIQSRRSQFFRTCSKVCTTYVR